MSGWPTIEQARRRGLGLAALVAVLAGLAALLTPFADGWEADSVDARFQLRPERTPRDVAVVDVDAASFADPAVNSTWPIPRSTYGPVLRRLRKAGAREIVVDVQFTEPSKDPAEDNALFTALGDIGGAVLATSESDARGATNVLGGDANLREVRSVAAAANLPDERGGVLRRFTYETGKLASIAVVVARRAGRSLDRGDFDDGRAWIDYAGDQRTVPTLSFADVLHGRFDRAAVRGRTIVIGTSSPTVHDLHRTPTSGDSGMGGPEVQANAIQTALDGLPLRDAPRWLELLAVLMLALAVPLLALRVRATRAVAVAPLLAAGYAALAYVAFVHGTVIDVAAPIVGLTVAAAATVLSGYLFETHERRRAAQYNDLLERRVQERTAEVRATQAELIERLSQAVELRDHETGDHVERIGDMAAQLAAALGLPDDEVDELRSASALHDVGKIGVRDAILLKPGPLDPDERAHMERHTSVGGDLLAGSASSVIRLAEVIARTHHEKWDGSGYPAGLKGEEIPLAGRITAIVDVFDALTSTRPYKSAWSVDDALDEIERQRGRHFDPELTDAFLALHGRPHASAGLPPALAA